MKIYKNVKQNTPEWFALRNAKFTCSDAQAIANNGVGLETLVFTKIAEKLTGKAMDSYTNLDMERGHELEEMARNSYELLTGNITEQVGFVEFNEMIGGSPDGLIGKDGIVEIKCKNDVNFVKFMYNQKIDSAHVWQIQMLLYIMEREWCDYVIFNPNFEKNTLVTRIERDEEAIKKLVVGLDKAVNMFSDILTKI